MQVTAWLMYGHMVVGFYVSDELGRVEGGDLHVEQYDWCAEMTQGGNLIIVVGRGRYCQYVSG